MSDKNRVDLVNKLLRECFGRGFSGNNYEFFSPQGFYGVLKSRELEQIRKSSFFNLDSEEIGHFNNPDGSSISVYPQFQRQAKEYGKRFYERLGQEVEILIMERRGYQETA